MAAAVHAGGAHHHASSILETVVCRFWLQGRCTRNPCKFAHALPSYNSCSSEHKLHSSTNLTWRRPAGPVVSNSPCSFFLRGSPCPKAADDQQSCCKFLHAHTEGAAALFTELEGHGKGCSLTGIALPKGSNILYTGGRDRKVKVWDCESGECIQAIPLEGEVGCLFSSMSDPDWLFVGIPDQVQVWNLKTQAEQKLCAAAPAGQVRALAAAGDMLFAGTDSGVILVWRFDSEALSFVPAVSLSSGAHSGPVHTLEPYMASDTKILFSGSADGSIRVWDLATGHCLHTLPLAHTGRVTGLLSWNQFLLSASLDGTLKVWRQEGAQLDLHYTHTPPTTGHAGAQTPGLIAFSGCVNEDDISILMCSYAGDNNVVRVYELPSFTERAVLFSADPIQSLDTGPTGLAFSGDRAGRLKVWRTWVQQQQQK